METVNEYQVEMAARLAHEANRAFCLSHGDNSQVPWDLAPEDIKDSARRGVWQIVGDPSTSPEQSHESWSATKLEQGWKYGPEKDAEKKTHPCLVPYAELPEHQRVKDAIFGAVVRASLASSAVAPFCEAANYFKTPGVVA